MADIFSKEKRSEIMSLIKGKDTKVELSFRKGLSAVAYPLGYRYRKHYKAVKGRPDVAFVGQKIAVFIDGDFWHGKGFAKTKHRLSEEYWRPKIHQNMLRDRRTNRRLRKEGWLVIRIWESDYKKRPAEHIGSIIAQVKKRTPR